MKKNFNNIFPLLQKKYMFIIFFLIVVGVLLPSYSLDSIYSLVTYPVLVVLILLNIGLYRNMRFNMIYKKLRPFIVVRIGQIIATLGFIFFLLSTIPIANEENSIMQFGIIWIFGLLTVQQYFSIFSLAKKAKKDNPDVCEFC